MSEPERCYKCGGLETDNNWFRYGRDGAYHGSTDAEDGCLENLLSRVIALESTVADLRAKCHHQPVVLPEGEVVKRGQMTERHTGEY